MNIETLKKYRVRSGLSQDEVSAKTGMDISMLESGFTKGITLSQLERLSKIYGCTDSNAFHKNELEPEIKTHILYKNY